MDHIYELDNSRTYENGHHEIIAILTGHEIQDIIAVSPDKDYWYARDYISVFNKLGFNTGNRFIKFDPLADKPCMMRFKNTLTPGNHWHAIAFYNQKLYLGNNVEIWFLSFIEANPEIVVTSMLQIWI